MKSIHLCFLAIVLALTLASSQHDYSGFPVGFKDASETTRQEIQEGAGDAKKQSQPPDELTNSIGMKFRLVPAGEFMMGAVPGDADASRTSKPRHGVEITKPFYIGIHEVTQNQWTRIMGSKGFYIEGPDHPAMAISWNRAVEFCEKLSNSEGVKYRLPTEAEWEYACRAGTETKYYWGNEWSDLYEWCSENSENLPHPVGERQPNPWGLFDMMGNVAELVLDDYDSYPYAKMRDPLYQSLEGETKVIRGSSWQSSPGGMRVSSRYWMGVDEHYIWLGFRVVREVK